MPVLAPVAPRQMLPPPTTTAMSTPRDCLASAISRAIWKTTSPSIELPPLSANASPLSFSTTRFQRGCSSVMPRVRSRARSPADEHLREADDGRGGDRRRDLLLLVGVEGLVEERAAGLAGLAQAAVPAGEPALDDLVPRLLGLALLLGHGEEQLARLVDLALGHLVARQHRRLGEGDVQGDLVGDLRRAV